MLDFQEFTKEMVVFLRKEYSEVRIQNVTKNNSTTQIGIVIVDKRAEADKKENKRILPLLYMERYYAMYEKGKSLADCLEAIKKEYEESKRDVPYVSLDFEEEKEKIIFRIVNRNKNEEMLKNVPHKLVFGGELAVVFHVCLSAGKEGQTSFAIQNSLAALWGVTVDELMGWSLVNTPKILPYTLTDMDKIMMEIVLDSLCDEDVDEKLLDAAMTALSAGLATSSNLFILTNKLRQYGASVLLYPGVRAMLEKRFGEYLVIPSSIHEVLILPYDKEMSKEKLEQMVKEVNSTDVKEDEILSDKVFFKDDIKWN